MSLGSARGSMLGEGNGADGEFCVGSGGGGGIPLRACAQVRGAINSRTVPAATEDSPARKKRFCLFMGIAPVSADLLSLPDFARKPCRAPAVYIWQTE